MLWNENSADYTTHITSINKYLNTDFWQIGPELLRTNTDELITKYCIEHLKEEALSAKQSDEIKEETKPLKAKSFPKKQKKLYPLKDC